MIEESAIPSLKRCWAILLPSLTRDDADLKPTSSTLRYSVCAHFLCSYANSVTEVCGHKQETCKIVNGREKGGIAEAATELKKRTGFPR
jgi:hypothetical protein